MLRRRSKVSTRFVITTSVIFAVIIILIVLSFLYILNINSHILKGTVLKNNDSYLISKVNLVADRIKEKDVKSLRELSSELKRYCIKDPGFLYIIIFSSTPDDNYYKIQKKIPLNPSIKIELEKNKIVQEKKDENYLKSGLIKPVIDPAVYYSNNQHYKTVYHPFNVKNTNYVLEFIMSSTEIINILDDYSGKINNIKKYSIIISAFAIVIIIISTLLFFYSFSLLIKNLAGHLKKVAEGPAEFVPDPTEDDDLNELTHSFSSAVSRIKQKTDLPVDLFKSGVDLLKEQKFNDAIVIFKTLTMIKPDSFGSYFNLGVAYAKTQKYDISLEMFEKASNANPGHELTMNYIAKVKRLIESQKSNGKTSSEA